MKKYRVKISEDKLIGPMDLDEFSSLVSKGYIKGSELFQEYPIGDWFPLQKFSELEGILKTTQKDDEATFIKKISDLKLGKNKEGQEEASKDEGFVEFKFSIEEAQKDELVLQEEINSLNEEEEKEDDGSLEKTLIRSIRQDHFEDNDKTRIKPETLDFLKKEKIKEEKRKEELEKERLEKEKIESEKIDLDTDATQFVNLQDLKEELKEETISTEEEFKAEEEKEKRRKFKEEKEKKEKKIIPLENPKEDLKKKKKKKIIVILVGVLLLTVLFPEKKEETKKEEIKILYPEIHFPTQYDVENEVKATEAFKEGLSLYKTYSYVNLLKANKLLQESVERKFENNKALSYLIDTQAKLIPFSKTKIEDANRVFKLVQVVSIKSMKDPTLMMGVGSFYLAAGKYNAAVKVIEQFNDIKSNKPTPELFGVYLSSLIKSGNYTKARKIYETLENIPKKSWEVYKPMIEFNFLNNDYDKVEALLSEARKVYPDLVELLIYYGRLEVYKEDFNTLSKILIKIKELKADHNAFYYSKYYEYNAILAVAKEKPEIASDLFKKALELYESAELRSKLANLNQSTDPDVNMLILESRALDFIQKSRKDAEEYRWKEAFKNALSATSIAPNFSTAKIYLAELQTKRSFFKEAVTSLEELYKNDPHNNYIVYSLLDTYIESYKFNDAKKLIEIISSTENLRHDPRFDATMSKYFLFQDNYESGVMWLERAINSNPLDDKIAYDLAKFFLKFRKYDRAKVILNKCMDLDPSNISYRVSYAEILYETEGTDAAIGYLYDLLRYFPDNVELLSAVGIYYFKSGQIKNFESIKEKLVALPKAGKSLYEFLIKSATLEENFDEVIEYSKKLLRIDPSDLKTEMFLGQVYMEKANYKEALKVFNSVKERLDTYPKLKYYTSKLYLLTGDTENAIKLAKEEVQENPGIDIGYVLLGDIYRESENFSEAEKWYKEGQKINAKNPETMSGLAYVSYKKSQFDIAIDLFKKAIAINPADKMSHKLLGDVYRQIGQSRDAIESYKNFLELSPESKYKDQIETYIRTMQ